MVTSIVAGALILSYGGKDLGNFELIRYEREDHFAGKLGYCVKEKLTLTQGEKVYKVEFRCVNLRFNPRLLNFPVGTTLKVKGTVKGNTISAARTDVVAVDKKK